VAGRSRGALRTLGGVRPVVHGLVGFPELVERAGRHESTKGTRGSAGANTAPRGGWWAVARAGRFGPAPGPGGRWVPLVTWYPMSGLTRRKPASPWGLANRRPRGIRFLAKGCGRHGAIITSPQNTVATKTGLWGPGPRSQRAVPGHIPCRWPAFDEIADQLTMISSPFVPCRGLRQPLTLKQGPSVGRWWSLDGRCERLPGSVPAGRRLREDRTVIVTGAAGGRVGGRGHSTWLARRTAGHNWSLLAPPPRDRRPVARHGEIGPRTARAGLVRCAC